MIRYIYIIVFTLLNYNSMGQAYEENYKQSLDKLSCMLNNSCELNFKEAVFIVENTFFDNQLDVTLFDSKINSLVHLCNVFINTHTLLYDKEDKDQVTKCASLFGILTDTLLMIDSNKIITHYPYTYDFNDIWGHSDWSNMFVSKLLATKKGNCHSLPYLYKILAFELGVEAHITVAPNHFYIKHRNKLNGWYNTELTSGIFPIDAWIMASGYVHLDAIVNKLYMEALDDKQSIALCVIDLAKGYQRKSGIFIDNEFIIQCCDTALKYYPHYINALLLKAETKKKLFEKIMEDHNVDYPVDILFHPEAKKLFEEMTSLYAKIYKLGYRKMPNEMYLKWLVSLKKERDKYENKKIINTK